MALEAGLVVVVRRRGRVQCWWIGGGVSFIRHGRIRNATQQKVLSYPRAAARRFDSPTPGRSFALKLLGRETNPSIMMF